jgi:hypothetical protein
MREQNEQNNDARKFGRTCGTCYNAIGSEVPRHPSKAKQAIGPQGVSQSNKNTTLPAGDSGPTFYNSVQPDRTPTRPHARRISHLSPTKYRIINQNAIDLWVLVGLYNSPLDTLTLGKLSSFLPVAVLPRTDLFEDKRDAKVLALRPRKRRVRPRACVGRGQDGADGRRTRELRDSGSEFRIEGRRDFGRLQEQAERRLTCRACRH